MQQRKRGPIQRGVLIVSVWLFDCICNLSERWLPKWVIKRLLCVKGGMGFQSCLPTTAEVDEAVEMPIVLTDAASPPVSSGVTLRKKAVTSSTENSNVQRNGGGMFICSYCSRSFATAGILKNHEQEHAEMMPYRCDICGKGFKHKRSQNRHHKLHSGQRKYKCTMCDSRFFRSDHLKLHMKTHEVSKYAFVCVLCQRGFNSNSALESHLQVYHSNEAPAQDAAQPDVEDKIEPSSPIIIVKEEEEEEYEEAPLVSISNVENPSQLRCDARSVGETLLAHAQSMHGLSVPKRSDSAPDVSNAERSGSVSTTGAQYACCVLCSLNFDSSEAFEAHLEAAHHGGTTDRPLLSQFNELASTLPSLTAGVDSWPSSNTATAYSCGFCGELKANVGDLQKHTLHKHSLKDLQLPPISADPTYDCDFCGRCFDSILALHCHASSAHRKSAAAVDGASANAQAYQCGQCDTALNPLRMFTGQMPALRQTAGGRRCHLCGLVAESDDRLNSHLLTHYLQKECRQCCQACGRWFPRADELNEHMFQVHAVHAYRCSLCGSLFDSRADMQRHLVAAHVDEQCSPLCSNSFSGQHLYEQRVPNEHGIQTSTSDEEPQQLDNGPGSPVNNGNNKCNICDKKCSSLIELAQHKLQHCKVVHSETCAVCRAPIGSVEQFFAHVRTHNSNATGGVAPACIICKQSLLSTVEMHTHAKFHLRLDNASYNHWPRQHLVSSKTEAHVPGDGLHPRCMLCQKVFISPAKLQCHLIEHSFSGGSGFQCYLCATAFPLPQTLQQHITSAHSRPEDRPYQCSTCGGRFFFRAELDHHTLAEHGRGAETSTTPSDETTVRYCFCGQSVPDLAAFQSHLSVCTAAKGGDPAAASALELLAWTAFPDDSEKVKQILALFSSAMAAVASTTTAPLTPTATSVELSVKAEPDSGVPLSTTAAGARQTRSKRLSSSPPAVLPAKMAKISASKTTTAVSAPITPTTLAESVAVCHTDFDIEISFRAFPRAHGLENSPVLKVPTGISDRSQDAQSPTSAQRRQAVSVRSLWTVLFAQRQFESPHENPLQIQRPELVERFADDGIADVTLSVQHILLRWSTAYFCALYAYAYSGAHMRKQYLHLLAVLVVTAETQALVSSVSFLQHENDRSESAFRVLLDYSIAVQNMSTHDSESGFEVSAEKVSRMEKEQHKSRKRVHTDIFLQLLYF
ncbi:zinc finger protein 423-like protein [Trichinella spiralis]|uniref:zinc finger protein 423-like protein n=1 Tax=Trichinella spiralis TaxID=6334 RepID=UPI0001EFE6B3|nr:zinc finger protein 423-like protein [Trichinella spiralis]